ncbi:MAG: hypothetical protein Q8942_05910 [Bacillota bacterium]|nr:hypothetical protein [Bacillota bacterium]
MVCPKFAPLAASRIFSKEGKGMGLPLIHFVGSSDRRWKRQTREPE